MTARDEGRRARGRGAVMNRTDRSSLALTEEYSTYVDHLIEETSRQRWKQERRQGGYLP